MKQNVEPKNLDPEKLEPKTLLNRELSWLNFNHRVLDEGMSNANPLMEKLKFLGIVSSNLDEFYMVRVAAIKNAKDQILPNVQKKSFEMAQKQSLFFRSKMVPALKKVGLIRLEPSNLTKKQKIFLKQYFQNEIFPVLTPIALNDSKPTPILSNLRIYILAQMKRGSKGKPEHAVVEIPDQMERIVFLPTDNSHPFMLIEDVIGLFLEDIFFGCKIANWGLVRLTREAELSLDEEKDEDFSKIMTKALRKRRGASIIRLEISADEPLKDYFVKKFKVHSEAICQVHSWLDLSSISKLAYLPLFNELKRPAWTPKPHSEFERSSDIWHLLKQKDICLHHPYDSFDPVIRFVNDAADDPHVIAIKQTLYRTEQTSSYISALERAAENGKRVTVLVELKARFNEEKNIRWADRLQAAGVTILYGITGFKTHAKVCLVIRKELEGIRRYVHLSTGNHNEKTAKLYSDLGYFTSDDQLTSDISSFFNVITGYSEPMPFSKIEISPHGLKAKLMKLIKRETDKAKKSGSGRILAKMNALVDPELIQALYTASNAGVHIKLNVRGTCCLRPGVKGMSEQIQVVSIVDMFLEHSRVFYFSNGGKSEIYLSSADWMPRSFERRIEIMFPIENRSIKKDLCNLLELYFKDNTNAWQLMPSGEYKRLTPANKPEFRIQSFLCDLANKKDLSRRKSLLDDLRPQKPKKK